MPAEGRNVGRRIGLATAFSLLVLTQLTWILWLSGRINIG